MVLNNLQNLRAIAAYSVVVYHCLIRFVQPTDVLSHAYLDLPASGVDLFFIISGFIMVHTTHRDETAASFAVKRVARVVPLYWAATFAVIAIVLFRDWALPAALLSPDSILASLLFIPHVDAWNKTYPILFVGWTLNYEMLFYGLFALTLFLPSAWRLPAIIALITFVWMLANAALSTNIDGDGVLAHFYAEPILFEFAAGCILAHVLRLPAVAAFVRSTPMWPFALAGAAGLAILPALMPLDTPSILRYGAPVTLLVFAAAGQDLYREPARQSLLTRLGDASYSAYLLHPVVMVLVVQATLTLPDNAVTSIIVTGTTLALTIAVSLLSLKYFERPATTFTRKLLGARRPSPGH